MPRSPLGRSLSLVALLALPGATGCRSYEYRLPKSPSLEPLPIKESAAYQEPTRPGSAASGTTYSFSSEEIKVTGALAGAPAVRSVRRVPGSLGGAVGRLLSQTAGSAPAATTPPAAVPISDAGQATGEMLDIEAHMTVRVARVTEALTSLRALVAAHEGKIINDVVEDQRSSSGAALSIRVPAGKTEAFLASLSALGRISQRRVTARDIGKEFHDAQILLKNLEAALARYQEILAKAQTASEILEIELAMGEVRTRIDRVKGDLLWMRDHAERSTIYVSLEADGPEEVQAEPKFFPGLRATGLIDISSQGDLSGMLGGGLSVQFGRVLNASMDLLRKPGSSGGGLDAFLLTLGSEFYSDLLGGGRRRFLNPYLGLRAGYARFLARSEVAAGASAGVEIYRSKSVLFDLHTQALALFGSSRGSHVAIVPALGLSAAF